MLCGNRRHFVHIFMLLSLAAYTLLGAICFCALEAPNERALNARRVEEARVQRKLVRTHLLDQIQGAMNGGDQIKNNSVLQTLLDEYDRSLLLHTIDKQSAARPQTMSLVDDDESMMHQIQMAHTKWTIWGGLYFASSVYTTIGCADIVAETPAGRLLTIAYALVGIPLVLTVLNVWGGGLFRLTAHAWRALARRCSKARRVLLVGDDISGKKKSLTNIQMQRYYDGGGRTSYCASAHRLSCSPHQMVVEKQLLQNVRDHAPKRVSLLPEPEVPLKLALFLLVCWIVFSACILSLLHKLTLLDGVYFFFIPTIMLDAIDDDYTVKYQTGFVHVFLMLVTLSFVAMLIIAIQTRIEHVFVKLIRAIDADFKKKLLTDRPRISINVENVSIPQSSTMLLCEKMSSDEEVVGRFTKNMGAGDQLLVRMLSQHQRRLLGAKLAERQRMRNSGVHTQITKQCSAAQTDIQLQKGKPELNYSSSFTTTHADDDDSGEEDVGGRLNFGGRPMAVPAKARRMYIYNIGD